MSIRCRRTYLMQGKDGTLLQLLQFNGKTTDLYSVFEGSIPSRSSINTIIMEEEKKKEEKQMCAIVESTITRMIQAVNDLGIQKEDIVLLTLKGVEWILVYYR